MTDIIEKTVEIAGFEIELSAEYEATWADFGIGAYEYWGATGVHHDYGWEIESLGDIEHKDIRSAVVRELKRLGYSKQNRRHWLKTVRRAVRQIKRELSTMSAEDVFSYDDLIEHANDHHSDGGQYEPEDDRE